MNSSCNDQQIMEEVHDVLNEKPSLSQGVQKKKQSKAGGKKDGNLAKSVTMSSRGMNKEKSKEGSRNIIRHMITRKHIR